MLPPGAILELKIHRNAFAARALPQTPLGELTALPRSPSWFSADRFTAGEGEGMGGHWRGGKITSNGQGYLTTPIPELYLAYRYIFYIMSTKR